MLFTQNDDNNVDFTFMAYIHPFAFYMFQQGQGCKN
jgi:hypothetical protein